MWQPIETTPTEPLVALLWFPRDVLTEADGFVGADYSMQIAYWDGQRWREQGTNHDVIEPWDIEAGDLPTHWMPRPAPPNAQKAPNENRGENAK